MAILYKNSTESIAVIQIKTLITNRVSILENNNIIKTFTLDEGYLDNSDTSGTSIIYLYNVEYLSTYTVSISGDGFTKDQIISINDVQNYYSTIKVSGLYKSGTGELMPLTVDHEAYGEISLTTEAITVNYTNTGSYQILCCNAEPIDLSDYSKLVVVGTITARQTSSDYGGVLFAANGVPAPGGTHSASHCVATANIATGETEQTTILDLSSINVTGYVGIRGGMSGTISQIYLA